MQYPNEVHADGPCSTGLSGAMKKIVLVGLAKRGNDRRGEFRELRVDAS